MNVIKLIKNRTFMGAKNLMEIFIFDRIFRCNEIKELGL